MKFNPNVLVFWGVLSLGFHLFGGNPLMGLFIGLCISFIFSVIFSVINSTKG